MNVKVGQIWSFKADDGSPPIGFKCIKIEHSDGNWKEVHFDTVKNLLNCKGQKRFTMFSCHVDDMDDMMEEYGFSIIEDVP